MNFFRKSNEFMNMGVAINHLHTMIEEFTALNDFSNIEGDLCVLAYLARRGILDRMDKYNWSLEKYIYIPSMNRGKQTLSEALERTVGKVELLSIEHNFENTYEEIINKGIAYYEVEKSLPSELLSKI